MANNQNTPSGLYALSIFWLLSVFAILFYAITSPAYLYLAIILIPLYIYMGVGIIKRWPGARETVMAVVMLLFTGALVHISTALLMEGQEVISTGSMIRNSLRLVILPVIFFYLRSAKVKSYFSPAT